jgi:hypothetical protein
LLIATDMLCASEIGRTSNRNVFCHFLSIRNKNTLLIARFVKSRLVNYVSSFWIFRKPQLQYTKMFLQKL